MRFTYCENENACIMDQKYDNVNNETKPNKQLYMETTTTRLYIINLMDKFLMSSIYHA